MTVVIGLSICLVLFLAFRYFDKWQDRREKTRTDEELQNFADYLRQSPDHELPEADAKFVESLFIAALKGQFDRRLMPIDKKRNRITNEYFIRAIEIETVVRYMRKYPGTALPPDLMGIAEREELFVKNVKVPKTNDQKSSEKENTGSELQAQN